MTINFDLKKYLSPVFVETRIFQGEGIERALASGFRKIISIASSEKRYKNGCEKFAQQIASGQVELIYGNSQSVLADVVTKLDQPATFWLDTRHNRATGEDENFSLDREINTISSHQLKSHTILIDNLRSFSQSHGIKSHNITLGGLIEKIAAINSDYQIGFEQGRETNDVLVASLSHQEQSKNISDVKQAFDYQKLAQSLEAEGKLDQAIITYQKAIRLQPNYYDFPLEKARLYSLKMQADLELAIFLTKRSLKLFPNYLPALFQLANFYESQQNFRQAISSYQTILQVKPNNINALSKMANAMLCNGDISGAIACYQKILQQKPENKLAQNRLFQLIPHD